MNIGRPLPLHGSVSHHLMDYHAWEQRAMRDRVIDANEAFEAVRILQRIVPDVADLAITVEHAATCLTGSRGIKSPRAIRGWSELQARQPGNVIAFPAHEDGGEAA